MKLILGALILFCFAGSAFGQASESDRRSNTPIEPFRIVGNVYYVGAAEVTAFLVTTPKGHILVDSGFAETAPQIKANVAKLGFKLTDIRFLLNTQAHFDHAGALAEIKKLTGAKMVASAADKELLANGGRNDFAFADKFLYEPVTTDRVVGDGDKLSLGGATLTAIMIPGHTKGSTAWTLDVTENGRTLNVLFFGSVTSPTFRFYGNKLYPNIIDDFNRTFAKVKGLRPDIFLASHGSAFGLLEKAQKLRAKPAVNPFVENETFGRYIADEEIVFRQKLESQKLEPGTNFTPADVKKLRWIEGKWIGMDGQTPFYERYRIEATTLVVESLKADGSLDGVPGRFELKNGEFGQGDGEKGSRASEIGADFVQFVPAIAGKGNNFRFVRQADGSWHAILEWPATAGKPARGKTYKMEKWTPDKK